MRFHRCSRALPLAAVLLIPTARCGFDTPPPPTPIVEPPPALPDPPPPEPPPNAMQRLARGLSVELDRTSSAISIAVAKSGDVAAAQTLEIAQGKMLVRLSGEGLTSAGLDVELGDVAVSAETFPPTGLTLTDLRGSIRFEAMQTVWADAKAASFDGTADVRVSWSIIRDGTKLPVRPLEIHRVPITGELEVTPDDRIALSLGGAAPGLLLDVAGLAQLSDLSLELTLFEPR